MMTLEQFQALIAQWRIAARAAADARRAYDAAYSMAFAASDGKTEMLRKADAEIRTSAHRMTCDMATIEERALHHTIMFVRGPFNHREEYVP